jgi:coenzyme F420-reducing hydrogenase delta subunit
MCSGRVDPALILETFINVIVGVMVSGCHAGDYHYLTGNYYTERRIQTLQEFLGILGVKPERLFLNWVSASEGERFANMVKNFVEKIKEIGPLSNDLLSDELRTRLLSARDALAQERMRWLINKERELLEEGNVFGEEVDQSAFNKVKFEALVREYEKNRILLSIGDEARSAKEIAQITSMSPEKVLRNLISMEQNGLVSVSEIMGVSPMYRRLEG